MYGMALLRRCNSITALVDEAAVSRLYGGSHYMFATDAAKVVGWQLANEIHDIDLVKSGHISGY